MGLQVISVESKLAVRQGIHKTLHLTRIDDIFHEEIYPYDSEDMSVYEAVKNKIDNSTHHNHMGESCKSRPHEELDSRR